MMMSSNCTRAAILRHPSKINSCFLCERVPLAQKYILRLAKENLTGDPLIQRETSVRFLCRIYAGGRYILQDSAAHSCGIRLLIDLLYTHQPSGNYMAGYRLLENAYKEGKIKAIGISNFHDEKLERLLAECEITPHVIQLEEHPYFSDTKTLAMLAPHGVKLMAWYPLGHGDEGLLNEPVFAELAAKHGKTTAQIILRWHVQNGTSVIPGSTNPDHIRENADIFDFCLTDEEMASIKALNKNERFYNPPADMEEKYAFFAIDLDSQP